MYGRSAFVTVGFVMSTTALIIIGVICLMIFSGMTGIVGGYFLFAGKFSGNGAMMDDLMNIVADVVPALESESPAPIAPAAPAAAVSVPVEGGPSAAGLDPSFAPTLAPSGPMVATASAPARPSQGDLSLDDFFSDFSVDVTTMSGDIPIMTEAAANRPGESSNKSQNQRPKRPETEPVDDSQVLGERAPEGA